MTREGKITVINYFLFGLILVLIMSPVWADDHECQGGHNCNDGSVLTGGDNTASNAASIAGSRSYGLGGGDMDIDDGYRSFSYLFGLVQDTKSNPLELARQLMAEGNYEAAAKLRCKPWGISRALGGKDACITALSVPVPARQPPIPPADTSNDEDEDDHIDELNALRGRLMVIESQRTQEAARAEKAAVRANAAAQRAERQQQQPDDGAERRAKARAALKGED
jgi:hypothetical protein